MLLEVRVEVPKKLKRLDGWHHKLMDAALRAKGLAICKVCDYDLEDTVAMPPFNGWNTRK